jgi:ABC-2 type transport system permease protein
MNKLKLIIFREYWTRVRKRTFILTTILTPLAFALFFVVVGVIFSYEGDEKRRIAIRDEAGILEKTNLKSEEDGSMYFIKRTESLDELKAKVEEGEYDGILVIPPIQDIKSTRQTVYYYAENQLSLDGVSAIEGRLASAVREYKIEAFGFDKNTLESLRTRITLDPKPLKDTDEDVSSFATIIAAGIGGIMGVIMYMAVFIYGMMVMRSVMEEKTSRIVEVMISSVRPFQLMLGKIIGVGAVGLTQVAIWAILIPLVYFVVGLIFGFDTSQMDSAAMGNPAMESEEMEVILAQVMQELRTQNWWLIMGAFLFFFVGGFFLYASLFAAVGSAMGDDMGEGQSLTLPITIPVIIAFYIMFVVVRSPQSTLAVWSSLFPLFSPIVMPARLAFDPPLWQVLLSIVLLLGTALFFIWLSARIYRVGILMYGKKVSFKELGKWIFYKE